MKKGFTLIELLAVIVILAIIALITTPLILNTIEKAKLGSYKSNIGGLLDAGEYYTLERPIQMDETLDLKNETKLKYKGERPKAGSLKINAEGKMSIYAEYGDYCLYRGYLDGTVIVKKGNCEGMYDYQGRLGIPTPVDCFETDATGTVITNYLCAKGNSNGKPEITELNLPEEIKKGVKVTTIQGWKSGITTAVFEKGSLTKINIPLTILKIEERAFNNNLVEEKDQPYIFARSDKNGNGIAEIDTTDIIGYAGKNKNVSIPETIKTIGKNGTRAFQSCELESVIIPNSITYIGEAAFESNLLKRIQFPTTPFFMGINAFIINNLGSEQAYIYERTADGTDWDKTTLNSYGGDRSKELVLPNTVKTIKPYALHSVSKVILPEGLQTINEFALFKIGSEQVIIPSTVISIKRNALSTPSGSLKKIINKTGKAFDWGLITGGTSTGLITTGTVIHEKGNIEVVAG